jgi:hypothetical protein
MKIQQGCHVVINNQNNVTTASTVTTIWAAKGDKLFAVNRNTTITTIAGSGMESYAVNKSCHS